MVTILQILTEISKQMQTFDDLEYTSRSLNESQKTCTTDTQKTGACIKKGLTIHQTIPIFNDPFKDIAGKGENSGNKHFFSFSCNAFFLSKTNQNT